MMIPNVHVTGHASGGIKGKKSCNIKTETQNRGCSIGDNRHRSSSILCFCYLVKMIKNCNGIINFGAVELYTYDTYNRLISYEGGDTYAEYAYNAEDYRCYKNVQENGFFDETYYLE